MNIRSLKFVRWAKRLVKKPSAPSDMWWGFSPCGCAWAWFVGHPSDMDVDSQAVLDDGPQVLVWLKIRGGQFTLQHEIRRGESYNDGPIRYTEPRWVDLSIEGCQRCEGSIKGQVLDAWFPPTVKETA